MTKRSIKSRSEAEALYFWFNRKVEITGGGGGGAGGGWQIKRDEWSRSKGKVTEKTLTKVLFMSLFL